MVWEDLILVIVDVPSLTLVSFGSKAFYYFSKAIQYEPHNKKLYTWRRMAARKTLFYPGCIKDLYCCILCCLDYGITLRKEMSRNI